MSYRFRDGEIVRRKKDGAEGVYLNMDINGVMFHAVVYPAGINDDGTTKLDWHFENVDDIISRDREDSLEIVKMWKEMKNGI